MANKYFYVHNGLQVGPITIDATTGTFVSTSTIASTSTLTGAVVVRGGVGIGGDLTVGKTIALSSGTTSTFSIEYSAAGGYVDFIFR